VDLVSQGLAQSSSGFPAFPQLLTSQLTVSQPMVAAHTHLHQAQRLRTTAEFATATMKQKMNVEFVLEIMPPRIAAGFALETISTSTIAESASGTTPPRTSAESVLATEHHVSTAPEFQMA
jgi:hypothetical protein